MTTVKTSPAVSPARDPGVVRFERAFLILSVVLAAVQAWIGRQSMGPDGISYLDIGDAYLRGDWKAAINGYWSPLYSVLLGTAMRIFRPSIHWEFPVVHLVNFLVFVGALFAFRYFLRSAMERSPEDSHEAVAPPAWVVLGMGYCIFLSSVLVLTDLVFVSPDVMVVAWVCLLGALLVQLRARNAVWRFAAFGAVCGLAYLTKGIMFPMTFVLLGALLFSGKISRARIGGVVLSAIVFALIASPFVLALSKQKGRPTYGDTGKLAYSEMVSPRAPGTNWQGDPPGSGVPVHPTRKLLDDPLIYEYAEPVAGTYPPWYDPSYWNEGMRWTFRLRPQLRVAVEGLLAYGKALQGYVAFIAGVVIFLVIGKKSALQSIARNWPLLLVACAAAGVYDLVLVKTRYIAGFVVVFMIAISTRIRLPQDDKVEAFSVTVGIGVIAAMLLSLGASFADTSYHTWAVGPGPSIKEQVAVAEGLENMGLNAGDRVVVLGEGLTDYWARLGKFKIVAEIASPDLAAPEFWAAPPEAKARAYDAIARTPARLIVAWNAPASGSSGWRQIAGTHYYAYVPRP